MHLEEERDHVQGFCTAFNKFYVAQVPLKFEVGAEETLHYSRLVKNAMTLHLHNITQTTGCCISTATPRRTPYGMMLP